jgi:hypothetical protein
VSEVTPEKSIRLTKRVARGLLLCTSKLDSVREHIAYEGYRSHGYTAAEWHAMNDAASWIAQQAKKKLASGYAAIAAAKGEV